jgi:hypothetical protein
MGGFLGQQSSKLFAQSPAFLRTKWMTFFAGHWHSTAQFLQAPAPHHKIGEWVMMC